MACLLTTAYRGGGQIEANAFAFLHKIVYSADFWHIVDLLDFVVGTVAYLSLNKF